MTSSAKWFLLFLSTFLDARKTFSSTHVRFPFLALLLAALGLFAAAPVSAAVLVSNIGQTPSGNATMGSDRAQGFTTGSNLAGYTLTSIEVAFGVGSSTPNIAVQLWSSSNGAPSAKLADLTVPSSISNSSNASFTAPSNTVLAANTTYFVVLVRSGGNVAVRPSLTGTGNEDSGAASGWSIADTRHSGTAGSNWSSPIANPHRIRVNGDAVPPTVTLSASPNPVWEGSSVTVTATLSHALSSQVTIPVTLTDNSAESSDYGTLSSITINSGSMSGSGTISTNHDADDEDETFTVELDTANLPSEVTAGTPSSVEITIRDDEGLRLSVKPSHPTPACGTTVTDTCVRPGLALMLTPAPAELTETEFRAIPGGEWKGAVSIRTDGHAGPASNVTFARLRELFPGFMGYEYRLTGNTGVTARCTWTVPDDPCPEPEPPTTRTPTPDDTDTPTNTGGTGTGGGGGGGTAPSRDTSSPDDDPAPDSTSCGESDREYLERFYEASGGDAWDRNENWKSQEPLGEWFGVKTDEDGEVISLRLSDNNLSGDMPTEELLCLNENTELKELALWDNEDLSGEVPEDLALAVERAALREIAEMLDLNPEWFEDYEDPFNFEDWYEGVTTDDEGRVIELVLPGEIPESIRSQFKKREITITTSSDGGCALNPEDSSAFSLFLLTLVVFAALGRKRAR